MESEKNEMKNLGLELENYKQMILKICAILKIPSSSGYDYMEQSLKVNANNTHPMSIIFIINLPLYSLFCSLSCCYQKE
jgi:hypothetical protein